MRDGAPTDVPPAAASTAPATGTAHPATNVTGTYTPSIDPADFVATVDNPYWPLRPGTKWTFEGESDDGVERTEVEVLADTRVVMGVTCVAVRDTVYLDDEMIEDTHDWYAQDTAGNVWYFGEDVKNYTDGVLTDSSGAWEAGVDGAYPGVVMWAHPEPGVTYRQEYLAGEAEDMARVVAVDGTATVAFGSYSAVVTTDEWTPLAPDVVERKSYAPGVGLISEEETKGGSGRSELVAMR